MDKLAVELFKINAVKFGDYKTKVGLHTPVYFDLRVIVSYPTLMESLADLMIEKVNMINSKLVCGVPYTALPIASIVSIKTKIPMVMRRKEAKSYGTKKLIEGVFSVGDSCLIIEDVVTSGSSILETVKDLRASGIVCKDAVVLLNRQQGGENFLAENGIKMHSILTISELMVILLKEGLIPEQIKAKVDQYIEKNKVKAETLTVSVKEDRLRLSFIDRIKHTENKIAAELFSLMARKNTNLCVAADLTNTTDIINLAKEVGPYICCLKTHIDIVEDFDLNFIKCLEDLAQTHEFVLMEDRKFADIGKTVQSQYHKGMFHISSWASLVTVHSLFGKGVLDGLVESYSNKDQGVFLLAEASSTGCLIDETYTFKTIKLALQYKSLVAGIVCQNPLFRDHPGFLQLTPGVKFSASKDNLGQNYHSPQNIIIEKGGDIAVVGRGISESCNKQKAAQEYRDSLWVALTNRISM